MCPHPAAETLYVGDRLDNDVRPAAAYGFKTALIRRGLGASFSSTTPAAERIPDIRIDSLAELPEQIGKLNCT